MKPVGYFDEAVFFGMVFVHSAMPFETYEFSLQRLERAIVSDAKKLGVVAEMSPQRVAYAYRHHPSLGQIYSVVVAEHKAKVRAEREARGIAGCASVDDILALYEYEWKNRRIEDYWTDERIGREMKYEAISAVESGEIANDADNRKRFEARASWYNEIERENGPSNWLEVNQKLAIAFFRSARKHLKQREERNSRR